MVTKKRNQQTTLPALRSRAEIMGRSAAELIAGQIESEEQAEIVRKTATDILRERAAGAKKRYGEQVVQQGALSTAHTHVAFVEALQPLRTQVQEPAAQKRIEQFLLRLEEEHVNAQLRLQFNLEDQVAAIVASPLDPPAVGTEEYIVEVPNLFQQFFGGQSKITRTRR
jgi:hypothetical protein